MADDDPLPPPLSRPQESPLVINPNFTAQKPISTQSLFEANNVKLPSNSSTVVHNQGVYTNKPSYSEVVSGGIHSNLQDDNRAAVLNNPQKSIFDPCKLKPITWYQGKPAVSFALSEKQLLVEKLKYVLVGKFSHGRPVLAKIRVFFASLKLNSSCNISVFDKKHIFIECGCKFDFDRIWLKLVWLVDGFAMRILKWTSDFNPLRESAIVPVWIRLQGLPLYLFDEMSLMSIANSIGKPIRVDPRNVARSIVNSASICVELDVSQPLVEELWVNFVDDKTKNVIEGFGVKVSYDAIPSFCGFCYHIGHVVGNCKRRVEKLAREQQQHEVTAVNQITGDDVQSNCEQVPSLSQYATQSILQQASVQGKQNRPQQVSTQGVIAGLVGGAGGAVFADGEGANGLPMPASFHNEMDIGLQGLQGRQGLMVLPQISGAKSAEVTGFNNGVKQGLKGLQAQDQIDGDKGLNQVDCMLFKPFVHVATMDQGHGELTRSAAFLAEQNQISGGQFQGHQLQERLIVSDQITMQQTEGRAAAVTYLAAGVAAAGQATAGQAVEGVVVPDGLGEACNKAGAAVDTAASSESGPAAVGKQSVGAVVEQSAAVGMQSAGEGNLLVQVEAIKGMRPLEGVLAKSLVHTANSETVSDANMLTPTKGSSTKEGPSVFMEVDSKKECSLKIISQDTQDATKHDIINAFAMFKDRMKRLRGEEPDRRSSLKVLAARSLSPVGRSSENMSKLRRKVENLKYEEGRAIVLEEETYNKLEEYQQQLVSYHREKRQASSPKDSTQIVTQEMIADASQVKEQDRTTRKGRNRNRKK